MPINDQDLIKSIIGLTTEIWTEKEVAWNLNTSRFEGGDDVYLEISPFRWESKQDQAYKDRVARAVYPEFPGLTAERMVGTLFMQAPTPTEKGNLSFGTLGEVREEIPEGEDSTRAELLFENTDGPGEDARGWDPFWNDTMQAAMATKYVWLMAEGPSRTPKNEEEEFDERLRPFLVVYRPQDVPFWHFKDSTLQAIRIERERVSFVVNKEGKVEQTTGKLHYVMTRRGFQGFGDEFAGGGWWKFDDDGKQMANDAGDLEEGDWTATRGAIPIARLYYERGQKADKRTGIRHLGNLAIAFMETLSWLWHDAKISGSRKLYFLGVGKEQWDIIDKTEVGGGINIPVPSINGQRVSIFDSGSVSASEALHKLLETYTQIAVQIIMRELTTSPSASGVARKMLFLQGNSPRLANMAANMQETQRLMIRFLEYRWTLDPLQEGDATGTVKWPTTFSLKTLVEMMADLFDLFSSVGATSKTLLSKMLLNAVSREGHLVGLTEQEITTIIGEIEASLELAAQAGQTPSALSLLRGVTANGAGAGVGV